jgi:hypothetical protein
MKFACVFVLILFAAAQTDLARAEDPALSRIDSITKSARDMMPAMPEMPSLSLPSMPDLSLPDFSDSTGRVMTEFKTLTQQVGDALPMAIIYFTPQTPWVE